MKIEKIFDGDFIYDPVKVNQYLLIIKTTKKNELKRQQYATLLFQMMKEIVNKNINNFISLLTNSGLMRQDVTREDLIADCYCIFDKCLKNYKISVKNNFYFYFNKSMSRSFFREYKKAIKKNTMEVGNYIVTSESSSMSDNHDMMQFLLDKMRFNPIQKEIIKSKLVGQRLEDFFALNPTITSVVYYDNLKEIKKRIELHDHEIGFAKIKPEQEYYSNKSYRIYKVVELTVTGIVKMMDIETEMMANHTKKEFQKKLDSGIFELLN